MGLDIIPAHSFDWETSLRAIPLQKQWEKEQEELAKTLLIPCAGFSPLVDHRAINKRCMEFCRENNLQYSEVADSEFAYIYYGRVNTGITLLSEYQLTSRYNEKGTNNVLAALNLPDLVEIFGVESMICAQQAETIFSSEADACYQYLPVDFSAAAEKAQDVKDEISECLEYDRRNHFSEKTLRYIIRQLDAIIHMNDVFQTNGYGKYRLFWQG